MLGWKWSNDLKQPLRMLKFQRWVNWGWNFLVLRSGPELHQTWFWLMNLSRQTGQWKKKLANKNYNKVNFAKKCVSSLCSSPSGFQVTFVSCLGVLGSDPALSTSSAENHCKQTPQNSLVWWCLGLFTLPFRNDLTRIKFQTIQFKDNFLYQSTKGWSFLVFNILSFLRI